MFVTPVGDLDGDGMADVSSLEPIEGGSQFMYGRRWNGDAPLESDFAIKIEGSGQQNVIATATGDLDGDSFPELLLSVVFRGAGDSLQPSAAVYLVRGTAERRSGTLQLTAADRWNAQEQAPPMSPSTDAMHGIGFAGDIDGDGSSDVLTNLASSTREPAVYLVPSTPRARD